jgi:DNA-binding transcriptional MerR regulator
MRGDTIVKHSGTQRLYYSIKEVAELFDEEQHILRYWEREFDCLRPSKNRAGNRTYTDKDLDILRVIKKLLRIDRIPVSEARVLLKRGVNKDLIKEAIRAFRIHETIDSVSPTSYSTATSSASVPTPAIAQQSKTKPTAQPEHSSENLSDSVTKTSTHSSPIASDAVEHLLTVLRSIADDLEHLSQHR